MTLTFDDGAALVTGGSGGIGSAIVERLAAADVPVAFTYHRGREASDRLIESCGEGRVAAYPWGSSTFDDAAKLVGQVRKDLGPIRFLVTAAGVAQESAFHTLSEGDLRKIVDINLSASISVARAVVTTMMKEGAGRIVLLSSVSGRRGLKGHTVYAATKAALEGFSRSLAREAGMFGVTVNCVAPGFIHTGMLDAIPDRKRKAWLERIPLGRAGQPPEVSAAVAYLLSREAAYVTGQTLVIDGGISL